MRQDKEPTVIFSKKYEEPEQQYHCAQHPGCRMIRLADGLRCQICGSPQIAIRTIMLNDPSKSSSTQALKQKK